ncbi:RNase P protein subunit [Dictyostelium discoideum AX4]|uniref:Probable ribonuclease P/MRP protein subunit POP5 n=1 Tax=Dictyostelium discoideum TaxID=44689 RepID=POP5_DICDI|nr:RNase P protein subunit [Dictyostelium discoideum AX4]Q54EP3.1 RecName: Full=Probable ribonuclease P/MRP protein subunit POP5 [Dictyostelium discoideum]EAL61815.1 RNase P protein subunit [Dictyostelium discoideum AX4]|eukprot:XP_635197.1 RNase P protein subunit [Dictyostelium discoideum AX4]
MVRLKNRYLMTEVIWHDNEKSTQLSDSWLFQFISNEVKEKLGELTYEAFKKTLKIIYVNPDTNIFIIRVSFEYYKSLWTALTLITSYYGVPIYFRMVHVGGSIRLCQKAAIKIFGKQISVYDKNKILRNEKGETIDNNNNKNEEPSIKMDSDDDENGGGDDGEDNDSEMKD